ncbi:MAG: hypothetical protein A3J70_03330 [Elusimicrobia bacterium RIFCSPHIGHO2_02_FULL_61_10]|nr:MAG: hypothetical protein A3I76_05080 [Elusimicrobia bacterium RIFCSPLOWO2_02_FULL_61_11]OGS14534.1 MAG: hypothetical protein A3J70_03330 [Elusimicrobia bacterium RIFCSPHIGHO2_02_FULL_61_10]
MKKKTGDYDPEVELSKGADLTASSYDKTQGVSVEEGKVTVGGKAGVAVITGLASGNPGGGIDGTLSLWLSIFRFKRPDGTVNHVAGWNIMLALKAGQSALDTAKAFAAYINGGTRPYKAKASGTKINAKIAITYTEK